MNIPGVQTALAKIRGTKRKDEELHAQRDWLFLLGTTLVLFLAVAAWSYFSFISTVRTEDLKISTEASSQKGSVTVDDIERIFTERAAVREAYKTKGQFIDPSK